VSVRPDIDFRPDPGRPGGWQVLSNGLRQSYVDLDEPTHLDFDYAKAIGVVLDLLRPGPVAAVHIGGAACTMPRYLQATRPGSAQLVLEPDTELTELVLDRLPLPSGSDVTIEAYDGRTGLSRQPDDSADVVVVDAFADGRVPAELTTAEFVADAMRVLRPDGVLVLDVADGAGSAYSRRVAATMAAATFYHVMIGFPTILLGRRFGNILVVGSRAELPVLPLISGLEAAAPRQAVLHGRLLTEHLGDAIRLTDSDPMASPTPSGLVYRP
jgi:catechol 2,3-dioxygenase-like lactoylglutathione lyase family enzyme